MERDVTSTELYNIKVQIVKDHINQLLSKKSTSLDQLVKDFTNFSDKKLNLNIMTITERKRKPKKDPPNSTRKLDANGSKCRIFWTDDETAILEQKKSEGLKWKEIKNYLTLNERTAVDCRDHWRNLEKKKKREENQKK